MSDYNELIKTMPQISYRFEEPYLSYFNKYMESCPDNILCKFIYEGWGVCGFTNYEELQQINSSVNSTTLGQTDYKNRVMFLKCTGSEQNFEQTFYHEMTHILDALIRGNYIEWKTEKLYMKEIEDIIKEEGQGVNSYYRSDIKEYVAYFGSLYIRNNISILEEYPKSYAFIKKFMERNDNTIEERLKNIESQAITAIDFEEKYNRLVITKYDKEIKSMSVSLKDWSNEGTGGEVDLIYVENNDVTFNTQPNTFPNSKITISYIPETVTENGKTKSILWKVITDRYSFKVNSKYNFTIIQTREVLPDIYNSNTINLDDFEIKKEIRCYDYNGSRTWTPWKKIISSTPTLTPVKYRGVKTRNIITEIESNALFQTKAKNFYIICRNTETDELFVKETMFGINGSNKYGACYWNLLTNEKFNDVALTNTYKSKSAFDTNSSIKYLSSSTSTNWYSRSDMNKCAISLNLDYEYNNEYYDVVGVLMSNATSTTSTTNNFKVKVYAYDENNSLVKLIESESISCASSSTYIDNSYIAEGYTIEQLKNVIPNWGI